jgi:hypothetical protein
MSFELQIWFFSSKFRFFSVRFSLTSAAAGVAGTAGTAASRQIMNRYANEQAFLFFFFFLFILYKAAGEIHQTDERKNRQR